MRTQGSRDPLLSPTSRGGPVWLGRGSLPRMQGPATFTELLNKVRLLLCAVLSNAKPRRLRTQRKGQGRESLRRQALSVRSARSWRLLPESMQGREPGIPIPLPATASFRSTRGRVNGRKSKLRQKSASVLSCCQPRFTHFRRLLALVELSRGS